MVHAKPFGLRELGGRLAKKRQANVPHAVNRELGPWFEIVHLKMTM